MTSTFYLLKDIEFNKDYAGVVDFDNKDLQRLYFQSRRVYGFPTTYNYIRGEIQSLRVEIPQIEVQKYSYFEFTNTTPDGSMKTYYAFIDDVRYVDPTTSQIIFTIDVWQTYLFDYEIKDSFIDREHQNRCSSDFRPIFNTEIEDIEVGSDYEITEADDIDGYSVNALNLGGTPLKIYWLEVIATEQLYNEETTPSQGRMRIDNVYPDNAGVVGVPLKFQTPFYVYYVPFIRNDFGINKFIYDNDDEENIKYWETATQIYMSVLTNPNVISVRLEKYPPFRYEYMYLDVEGVVIIRPRTNTQKDKDSVKMVYVENSDNSYIASLRILRDDVDKIGEIENNYTFNINKDIPRQMSNETKLRQYPYEFLAITNYRGDNLRIKPEDIGDFKYDIKYKKSIGFDSKTKVYVDNYLGDSGGKEFNIIDNSINELPLMTDAFKEYINNSKATATTGVAVNASMGVAGAAAGAALLGAAGPAGALAFLSLGLGMTGLTGVKSELMKQSDLKETPLSERKSGNNLLFDMIDNNLSYRLIRKRIKPQYYSRLYDYFYRYGYKANRFGVPNLRSRYYFNYIKTINIDIVGNINSDVKEKLKQIYNNGTTIWHCRIDNPDPELFVYEKENAEVDLL